MHDGDVGCEPELPVEDCPSGMMAVPGELDCRPIGDCGDGTWGDLLVDGATVYVDGSFTGNGDGSAAAPWTTITQALTAAPAGALVAIAAGSYVENVAINDRPVRLWGVCPAEVEVMGTGTAPATVLITTGADGTEIGGLTVRGNSVGIALSGSQNVTLRQLWIVGNASRGLSVEGTMGPTAVTVSETLVEGNGQFGIIVVGADATIESAVVRGSLPDAQGLLGRGISIEGQPSTGPGSTAAVSATVVEHNREIGVFVQGSVASFEQVVIRGTLPDGNGGAGRGLSVEDDPSTGITSTVALRDSLLKANQEAAVFVEGSELSIEATVIRDTVQGPLTHSGRGVHVQSNDGTGNRSSLRVQRSLIMDNRELGVFAHASDVELALTVVRDTWPDSVGYGGRGLHVEGGGVLASATVDASVFERSSEAGIACLGAALDVAATVVSDTVPNGDGLRGSGVIVQSFEAPSVAHITTSRIEGSYEVGIGAIDSVLTVADTLVAMTQPSPAAAFGDGVTVFGTLPGASALVDRMLIRDSHRAGLSVHGGALSVGDTRVQCAAVNINGEAFAGHDFELEDRGGNACGCPEATGVCQVMSAALSPPAPLDEEETID